MTTVENILYKIKDFLKSLDDASSSTNSSLSSADTTLTATQEKQFGSNGRVRIDLGETYNAQSFYAVKAITSDFTYGAGCAASAGEAPMSGDPLPQGDTDYWPGTAVEAASGSAWVYIN